MAEALHEYINCLLPVDECRGKNATASPFKEPLQVRGSSWVRCLNLCELGERLGLTSPEQSTLRSAANSKSSFLFQNFCLPWCKQTAFKSSGVIMFLTLHFTYQFIKIIRKNKQTNNDSTKNNNQPSKLVPINGRQYFSWFLSF